MLPAHIARNIREQVLYYLQSTFSFRERAVERAFQRFVEDPENGLFKGPWVQLKRPFRPAHDGFQAPFAFATGFHPFVHQSRAWQRLHSNHRAPESTIVTTGTGSGKTECFLFPVLDHCLRARQEGQQGIKAIVLYPMNALASDQERRFAKVIWKTSLLKGHGVRVGTYTGRYDADDPGASANSGTMVMGEDHGISNHTVLLESPPDILLTNYRMLDFLLMRPKDQNLWRFNEPGVLKYLVLDELHTYDGAQGSDVACLIRRLKERLGAGKGSLCVVGTSATLDDRAAQLERQETPDGSIDATETAKDRLARFASKLFEEEIGPEAVIDEDRLKVEEIVHPDLADPTLPTPADCAPRGDENALAYTQRQVVLWGGPACQELQASDAKELEKAIEAWRVQVGDWTKRCSLFKGLLETFHHAEVCREDPVLWSELVDRLSRLEFGLQHLDNYTDREQVVASFLAIVAHAQELRSGNAFPLVPSQVQVWIRELRRVGRVATDRPIFSWLDEPPQGFHCLPAFQCSECGESGWVGLNDISKEAQIASQGVTGIQLRGDTKRIYASWFSEGEPDRNLYLISPYSDTEETAEESVPLEDDGQQEMPFARFYLCPGSLVVRKGDGPCPMTGDARRFAVKLNHEFSGPITETKCCPNCGSKDGVFFIGSQAATLSSVAIDEMFGSTLNNDPKMLAFTDSVQDASHRAGFFTARTYHFTFRTALQHVVDAGGGAGVPLPEVGKRLFEFWADSKRLESAKQVMGCLMPPDLHEYPEYVDFRGSTAATAPPATLLEDISTRLTWEATSEFGLMQTHGRTMEPNGSSALGWKPGLVEQTVQELREHLEAIHPLLTKLSDASLTLWLLGMLHRYRERGALDHAYLLSFAQQGFWGKFPFGRVVSGRETYPGAGRFKPKLMVTEFQRNQEHVLAATRGNQLPWHILWTRRVFGQPNVEETSLLDLIRKLLEVGTRTGLFKRIHQDGSRESYVIAADAAVLFSDVVHFTCSQSGRSVVRPADEAAFWDGAVSMEYRAPQGIYRPAEYSLRQKYYQSRYHKGALRRVVAQEHTGLLETELREDLERTFSRGLLADDPNILTCTSTLEMGIDIGDLSSTMLCSIPPNTASYLQRIGRAGRATGTALIVSIVNQKPHDLFFFARPSEMLKGRVEPPGCWLDASAVLARQYLGFCFDSATHEGVLKDLPRTAKALWDDMRLPQGNILGMMEWITLNEEDLRGRFLHRFAMEYVRDDTRERFLKETESEILLQRMHQAANEFDRMSRDLKNAQTRLREQLKALEAEEHELIREINRELNLLKERILGLNKITSLELLTDHGLLPNYAFPERGVRFYGAVYNGYRTSQQELKPVDIVRGARPALRELAPWNHFYTHSRQFDIQQLVIGNPQQPLSESWGICGVCGHMRREEELTRSDALPACPQCGHEGDNLSQLDLGQRKRFLEFPKSQALSYMEHYESLSADRNEERQQEHYTLLNSFDQTVEAPSGAVGDDQLPFGIEYRAAMVMREVNTGYAGQNGTVPFGPNQSAPDEGFQVCQHCGVVVKPDGKIDKTPHRRSCSGRRQMDKMKQEGRSGNTYKWESVYLYRQLRSEAVRLLLPFTDENDLVTLRACVYLGLRLRFEGNPAHLLVESQILPSSQNSINKNFLLLMDAVPGGTGFLKSLYQEVDDQGRMGEGIMDVLRRAKNALESCSCRQLVQSQDSRDTDGCYRCIRTYHLQYAAEKTSRERGIRLLTSLIDAGDRREQKEALDSIKIDTLYGSVLEQKFVEALKAFVETQHGRWEATIVRGNRGFRFSIPPWDRLWEIELQPSLGQAQGIMVQSQPDFLLTSDDPGVKPIAVFTDGFEFHCRPNNRIADDFNKRRAIIQSGIMHVWSVTWDDIVKKQDPNFLIAPSMVVDLVERFVAEKRARDACQPKNARNLFRNGLEQLKEYLQNPAAAAWGESAELSLFRPLSLLLDSGKNKIKAEKLRALIKAWATGTVIPKLEETAEVNWVFNSRVTTTGDFLSFAFDDDILNNRRNLVRILGRLGDGEQDVLQTAFADRWRLFLYSLNLYQFCEHFQFWSTSDHEEVELPDLAGGTEAPGISKEWQQVKNSVSGSLRALIASLSGLNVPPPTVEYYCDSLPDEAFAELAWPDLKTPVCVLIGEQSQFTDKWTAAGWRVVTFEEIQAQGPAWLAEFVTK